MQRKSHLQQTTPSQFITQKLRSLWKLSRFPKNGKARGERANSPAAFRSSEAFFSPVETAARKGLQRPIFTLRHGRDAGHRSAHQPPNSDLMKLLPTLLVLTTVSLAAVNAVDTSEVVNAPTFGAAKEGSTAKGKPIFNGTDLTGWMAWRDSGV